MFRNTLPGLVVFTVLVSGFWVFCIANQASIFYVNSCPVSPPIRVLMSNSYRVKILCCQTGLSSSMRPRPVFQHQKENYKLQCFSVRNNPALPDSVIRVVNCFHSGHLAREKWVNAGVSNNTNQSCYPFRTKRIQMLFRQTKWGLALIYFFNCSCT